MLGDARLNRRVVRLSERLAEKPTASLPGACRGWAETQGAYRLLAQEQEQEQVDWRDLLAPHWTCTHTRMQADHKSPQKIYAGKRSTIMHQ